ncbi:hypothetical protein TNCV_3607141 [Trichonephila clavipes]|nr:hypothetical protein TNCV_3607141 [Trichonephila clavipes]
MGKVLKQVRSIPASLWSPPAKKSAPCACSEPWVHFSENFTKQKGIATAGSDVVQSGRPIFDDFFRHLWPYIGNNTANVVFQMVKRLWLIRIDQ